MPDNRNKTGNQDKQQRPMPKEHKSDKDVGSDNREIQKDRDTVETDEQGEITQRNPRMVDDDDDVRRGAD